ncbi:D-alanyl-D-alanine carboxypeptidase family protein [Jatrophihabitans fulvus]
MTSTLERPVRTDAPRPDFGATVVHGTARPRSYRVLVAGTVCTAVLLVLTVAATVVVAFRYVTQDSRRDYLGADGWPVHGQAALVVGDGAAEVGPRQRPAPIASMAKVMTALLVLREHPLRPGSDGFTVRVTGADVAMTQRQRDADQSVVRVAEGETLSERQALVALLLPSANNVAVMLARAVAGSQSAFVSRMNAAARRWGMAHTHYADASGYDPRTVSTAADQLRLARVAARDRTFSGLVALRAYHLPVAGDVRNTDILLGRDGFVGTKTGSHDAAGGCFMFRAIRNVDGRRQQVIGVVMGQPGRNLAQSGQYAARQLVERRVGPFTYADR